MVVYFATDNILINTSEVGQSCWTAKNHFMDSVGCTDCFFTCIIIFWSRLLFNSTMSLHMLCKKTSGLFTVIDWKEFEGLSRTARVILKRPDSQKFCFLAHSPFASLVSWIVLILYSSTASGWAEGFFLTAVPSTEPPLGSFATQSVRLSCTWDMILVKKELQHLPLSKIVGKVPFQIQCGLATNNFGTLLFSQLQVADIFLQPLNPKP
jgi:hypothetical protein